MPSIPLQPLYLQAAMGAGFFLLGLFSALFAVVSICLYAYFSVSSNDKDANASRWRLALKSMAFSFLIVLVLLLILLMINPEVE